MAVNPCAKGAIQSDCLESDDTPPCPKRGRHASIKRVVHPAQGIGHEQEARTFGADHLEVAVDNAIDARPLIPAKPRPRPTVVLVLGKRSELRTSSSHEAPNSTSSNLL